MEEPRNGAKSSIQIAGQATPTGLHQWGMSIDLNLMRGRSAACCSKARTTPIAARTRSTVAATCTGCALTVLRGPAEEHKKIRHF